MDLFDHAAQQERRAQAPLADRVRPQSLDEILGQAHLLGEGTALRKAIEADRVPSLLLWGPPGSGKTSLAKVIARHTGASFEEFSAVLGGVKEIRNIIATAKERWKHQRRRTILFVDEIHRFNRAQQDAFLPHVEDGTITLIGATTENPSFEVNAALLSRCQVQRLQALDGEALLHVLRQAIERVPSPCAVSEAALRALAEGAWGDARRALNGLENALAYAAQLGKTQLDEELAQRAASRRVLLYDRAGEEHYNVISAFIKAMRGSDPDAAVYWLVRMLEAGEDPRFVCRRMIIFASEDVGNADPRALQLAVAAAQAYDRVGLPEAALVLTQAAGYLALAPQSNTVLKALARAKKAVRERGPLPVPKRHRNATSGLAKAEGDGENPRYAHDFEARATPDDHLPEALAGLEIYTPSGNGEEEAAARNLTDLRSRRQLALDPTER